MDGLGNKKDYLEKKKNLKKTEIAICQDHVIDKSEILK